MKSLSWLPVPPASSSRICRSERVVWGYQPLFGGFPGGSDCKGSACNVEDLDLIPGLRRSPWRRAWQPAPVFLTGESPWTEEPDGPSPCGCKELDTTKQLSTTAQHSTTQPLFYSLNTYVKPEFFQSFLKAEIKIQGPLQSKSCCWLRENQAHQK